MSSPFPAASDAQIPRSQSADHGQHSIWPRPGLRSRHRGPENIRRRGRACIPPRLSSETGRGALRVCPFRRGPSIAFLPPNPCPQRRFSPRSEEVLAVRLTEAPAPAEETHLQAIFPVTRGTQSSGRAFSVNAAVCERIRARQRHLRCIPPVSPSSVALDPQPPVCEEQVPSVPILASSASFTHQLPPARLQSDRCPISRAHTSSRKARVSLFPTPA